MKLTDKQKKVLEAVDAFIKENNYPPTHTELKNILGYSSASAIVDFLIALEKKGYIKRTPNIARSIVVLEK